MKPEQLRRFGAAWMLGWLTLAAAITGRTPAQEPFSLATWVRPVPRHSVLAEPGYYVWGGSVVEDGGQYHMFYSRWPTSPWSFGDGWLFASEICHAVANTPDGPFQPTGVVLGRRANDPTLAYWDSQTQHNPHIRQFGTRFYLYYMASVDPGAVAWPGLTQRNRIQRNQRIGVVVANSVQDLLTGNFARPNAPIVTPVYSTTAATDRTTNPTDYASNRIVNNQSVIQRPDGMFQLLYKSNWPQAPGYGHGYALATNPAGPFTQMPPPIFSDQGREDENHWYDATRNKYFLLCKNFGGGGTEQLESNDAIHWTSSGVQLGRAIPWDDGITEPLEALERPQLLRDAAGEPVMLYMAARRALGGGAVASFNVHIPLRAPTLRATVLTGAGDIETTGTLVAAVNLGATQPMTLNGLPFAASGSDPTALAATYGFTQAGGAAGAALAAGLVDSVYSGLPEFEDFLDTMVWQTGTAQAGATLSFVLSGLTPGNHYRCQLFLAESRTGTPSRHGPQFVRVGIDGSATFDFGPASLLVAPGANALRIAATFVARSTSEPVVFTQMVGGGGGLQLAAFALHDLTAASTNFAPGCQSSGGSNTLLTTSLPRTNSSFHATGTGLPTQALVCVVTGFAPLPVPLALSSLLPQGRLGCDLHIAPDLMQLLVAGNGTAQSSLFVPDLPAFVGATFYQQMVPIESAGGSLGEATATNALRLSVGAF